MRFETKIEELNPVAGAILGLRDRAEENSKTHERAFVFFCGATFEETREEREEEGRKEGGREEEGGREGQGEGGG